MPDATSVGQGWADGESDWRPWPVRSLNMPLGSLNMSLNMLIRSLDIRRGAPEYVLEYTDPLPEYTNGSLNMSLNILIRSLNIPMGP